MKYEFSEIVEFLVNEILRKWIYGLKYTQIGQEAVEYYNNLEYTNVFYSERHFLSINNEHYIFYIDLGEISSIERAFIDWSIGISYNLYRKTYELSDIKTILSLSLFKDLIATSVIFDGFSLSYPWAQVNESLRYFSLTESHYDDSNYRTLNANELLIKDIFLEILNSLEKLNQETYEGDSYDFTVAYIKGKVHTSDHLTSFASFLKESYSKAISNSKVVIYLDENANLISIEDISKETLDEGIKLLLPISQFLCEEDREYIINKIVKFQFSNYNKSLNIISKTKNNNICIYKNQGLLFRYKSGQWNFNNLNNIPYILWTLLPGIDHNLIYKMRMTLFDKIMSNSGCCIGIFSIKNFKEIENSFQIGTLDSCLSSMSSVPRCFTKLTRELAKTLLDADGAVIIAAEDGAILNVGTIVNVSSVGSQGGRTTAAKTIASLGGIGVKISDDGYLVIYGPQKGISLDQITETYALFKL